MKKDRTRQEKQQITMEQQKQAIMKWVQVNTQNLQRFTDTQLLLLQHILNTEVASRCLPFMPSLSVASPSIIIPGLHLKGRTH